MKSLFCYKGCENIAKNEGKKFEDDIKSSVPDNCWIYRLRDNASSFANGTNTRFTSSNICDYILLDDTTKTLFLVECKTTNGTSIPLTMIRDNQIKGLKKASKHHLVAGLLVNFRNERNDTFFISINKYLDMMKLLNKKSFNIYDLEKINATRIESEKKRTRYRYNINKMINELHL
jgi:recombination protein U